MKTLKFLALIGTMLFIVSCHNGEYYTVEITDHHGQKDTMIVRSTTSPYIMEGTLYVENKGTPQTVSYGIDRVTILNKEE